VLSQTSEKPVEFSLLGRAEPAEDGVDLGAVKDEDVLDELSALGG
jgi:hypothetical protein